MPSRHSSKWTPLRLHNALYMERWQAPEIRNPQRDEEPTFDPLWWYGVAACRDMPRETFFAHGNSNEARRAIAICNGCPVWELCLLHGLSVEPSGPDYRHGIFGRATPAMRQAMGIIPEEAHITHHHLSREMHDATQLG